MRSSAPPTSSRYTRAASPASSSENGLKPLEAKGVALLIDEAARKAGGNGKLSTEIGHIADVCREADHWAQSAGRETTSGRRRRTRALERSSRGQAHASAS